jgi:TonB family protein
VAEKADYRPKDPSILRQNTVDRKARLLTSFEPDSNEFAQAAGVAGMAQYHAVIGPDGKVKEVAVSRPIGFGLDESAIAAIRKAKFEPAIKDGKPVAVLLDLDVPFRIFSKRTNVHAPPEAADKPAEPQLPGPYSLPRPEGFLPNSGFLRNALRLELPAPASRPPRSIRIPPGE